MIHVTKSVCFVGGKPMIKLPKSKAGRRDVVLLDALEKVLPDGGSGYLFGGNAPWLKSQTERNWLEWCKAAGLAHELVTVAVDPQNPKEENAAEVAARHHRAPAPSRICYYAIRRQH